MNSLRVLSILCGITICASNLHAQKPDPGMYSPEKYETSGVRGIKVPMHDSVKLSVDIYRPLVEGKFPAILIQTPYSNNGAGTINRAKWFARRGYAVIISDSRGRYDSEGEFDPFNPLHKSDGYDLVEWIAKEPRPYADVMDAWRTSCPRLTSLGTRRFPWRHCARRGTGTPWC
mgnify:CR=1 FL=1